MRRARSPVAPNSSRVDALSAMRACLEAVSVVRQMGKNSRERNPPQMPVAAKVWPSGSRSRKSRPRVSLPNHATRMSAAAVGTMMINETTSSGRTEREHRQQLSEHSARLGAGGDRPRGPAADAQWKALRRIRQEHGDQRVGADDQQRDRQHRTAAARELKPEHAREPGKRDCERSRQPTISCSSGCRDRRR